MLTLWKPNGITNGRDLGRAFAVMLTVTKLPYHPLPIQTSRRARLSERRFWDFDKTPDG